MKDLFKNHIVGFLMTRLIRQYVGCKYLCGNNFPLVVLMHGKLFLDRYILYIVKFEPHCEKTNNVVSEKA